MPDQAPEGKIADQAFVLLSGGQDSFASLMWAMSRFSKISAVIINYGQRHQVEIEHAVRIAEKYKIDYKTFDISGIFNSIAVSALLDKDNPVDDAARHKHARGLPASFVPGRNGILLTIAATYAFKTTDQPLHLVTGVCQSDYSGYPDCRDNFIKAKSIELGLGLDREVIIHAPLMWLNKAAVFKTAARYNYLTEMINMTMSCYNGDHTKHQWGQGCGNCPACRLRRQAFAEYQKNG
ncbi:MAG TPA: 7-cyano-7-deazaguanine synthase QueC [Spirochaetota bacterium]|nr:7-cyano-7-deazaguanine synthase QueC [Spirochaetota bacterium]